MARFSLHEIEHDGDEQESVDDLRKAGCTNIRVVARDYECCESIVVECDLPPGVTKRSELQALLEFACL